MTFAISPLQFRELGELLQKSAQIDIDFALELGATAGAACTAKAQLHGFDTEQARAFVLAHLAKHGACWGEDVVDAAESSGRADLFADDGRAWGSVFKTLAGRHQIRCLRADGIRRKGRGTAGARMWGLVQ